MKILAFLFCLAVMPITNAQVEFDYQGHLKNTLSNSKYLFSDERVTDNLLQLRLNTRTYFSSNAKFILEGRVRYLSGKSLSLNPMMKGMLVNNYNLFSLQTELQSGSNSWSHAEIDRLSFDFQKNKLQITIGRQRIAWGTSWVWNITDLFNPLSVLDFDYEERPGQDAIRIQYFMDELSRLDFAISPAKPGEITTTAIQYSFNKSGYDFNFLAGVRGMKMLGGFSWAGDIGGAGFRGEIIVTQKPKLEYVVPAIYSATNDEFDKLQMSSVLSFDYTFTNSFYLHTEFLYNNLGRIRNAKYFLNDAQKLNLLSPARFSVCQEFAYNISPLVRGTIFAIYNPDDKSIVVMPNIIWSAIENLDLSLVALLFDGSERSEFGGYGKSFYARAKYSF